MSDDDLAPPAKDLRDRVRGASEETIGKLAQELLSNPLVTGAVHRAMDVRERATQAQEAAFSALNVPTAADVERLTRRVRNVAQRLEAIEDAVDRVDDRLRTWDGAGNAPALAEITRQLAELQASLAELADRPAGGGAPPGP